MLSCISITIEQIGRQIQNYENKDTVWQISEMYPPEILTPLIIFCSEPHIFESKTDIVHNTEHTKEFPEEFLQIQNLKTSLKVPTSFRSAHVKLRNLLRFAPHLNVT